MIYKIYKNENHIFHSVLVNHVNPVYYFFFFSNTAETLFQRKIAHEKT